ncbi:uncharacterized protein BJ212DRAFT_1405881 [Suillus subaureus]|uniref:Secreted protein n=1 Tax=Suillus subaureus TaxID=48587 RepID=A0A9P7DL80_9AGAM|nr:uncharacterized protein BJ212DRAFT_1405881 [Suillus subaureus]KAG1797578.1 hypothetical protein BJ212DRAFT_1405881 [Suillus subaureus]
MAAIHQRVCAMISIFVHIAFTSCSYHGSEAVCILTETYSKIAIDCVNFTCSWTLLNTASRIMKYLLLLSPFQTCLLFL